MKRAALYVRVSTEEQKKHGLSVDNQIQALEDYCVQNEYIKVGIYNDAGISARKSYKKRPALLQLIEDCKAKKVDIILFTRLDRFFRSVPDYYACMEQVGAVPWRAIWEDYETETSQGVFKVNIMLAVAQAEADRTSEKIKSVLQYKKAKGEHLGSVPTGYMRVDKKLVKDPNTEQLINDFFKMALEGKGAPHICKQLSADYNIIFLRNRYYQIIHNPTYRGIYGNSGCPAYITKEQGERLDKLIQTTNYTTSSGRVYIFSSLIVCANCGKSYVGFSSVSSKALKTYTLNYSCWSKHSYGSKSCPKAISEKKIEKYLLNCIDAEIDREIQSYKSFMDTSQKKLANKEKALRERLKRIGDRYEVGDLSRDEYFKKRADILDELSKVKYKPPSIPSKLPEGWQDLYLELSQINKRSFWRTIIDSIIWTGDFATMKIIWK